MNRSPAPSHFTAEKWVGLTLGLLVLIPVGFEKYFSISISGYDVRLSYLALGLLWVMAIARGQTRNGLGGGKTFLSLLLFLGIGLVGVAQSAVPKRSVALWLWAAGILVTLPVTVPYLMRLLRSLVPRALLLYGSVLTVALLWDAMAVALNQPGWVMGGVQDGLRPHGFRQEPAYWSVMMLGIMSSVWALRVLLKGPWFWAVVLFQVLASVALVLTASRVGWLGLSVFLFMVACSPGVGRSLWSVVSRHPLLSFATFAILAGLLSATLWANHPRLSEMAQSTYRSYRGGLKSGSIATRWWTTQNCLEVFQKHPWFGAGTGGGGAALADGDGSPAQMRWLRMTHDRPPHPTHLSPDDRRNLRENPLASNLYSELLAEWGILGTFSFFVFLFFLTRGLDRARLAESVAWLVMLLTLWLASESLPRLDIWLFLVITCWALNKHPGPNENAG